ncbi:MAG: hypothetical protein U1F39_07575 [Steroidobacteraceae bacterium]
MNHRTSTPLDPWPRAESWWKASDRCIRPPRLKWSRPLLKRLRELRLRCDASYWPERFPW